MTQPSNRLSQFWQEFRRRKVLPFLIGYIAACFAIIEFFKNTSERYSIPDTIIDLIYILAAIGLPIVIVLPWFINKKKQHYIPEEPATKEFAGGEEEIKVLHNLPVQLTTFIGREKETRELSALVENSRLITITGAGGCGKTRISLQIAREFLDKFSDGVWFVNLAPLEDPELLPQELADTLSISEEQGKPIASTLKEQIKEMNCMLLLDNCEHLVDATANLAQQLLSTSPDIKVLTTSREALKINGEVLWRVPSLTLPEIEDQVNLEKLGNSEAIQLFLDRAKNGKPGFQLDEQNAITISQICRQLEGIPLAIELAATRIRHMEPKMIMERIKDRFQLLTSDRRSSGSRQKTLKATIDWSYDLLTDKERLLFERLSVFSSGFLVETAEEICSDNKFNKAEAMDTLSNLVDKSMVIIKSRQEGSVRYGMLETLKEYASERLTDSGEKEIMDKRHFSFFLSILDRAFEERIDKGNEWADKIETDHDEYLKAVRWAEKDPELFLQINGGLGWFWEARSHYGSGIQQLKQALEGHRDNSSYTARALMAYGSMAVWIAKLAEEATVSLEEALSIWSAIGNKMEAGHLHYLFGSLKVMCNEIESSLQHFQKAYSIFNSFGDPKLMVLAKFGLGFGHICSFHPDKGEPLIKEALAEAIKYDMKREIGFCRHAYADCALLRKEYSTSFVRYRIALKAVMEAKDYGQAVYELQGIAMSLAGKSYHREAIMLNVAALNMFEQLGIGEINVDLWVHCMEETIGKARKELGEEAVTKAEKEGIAMGFDKAVEYALDFEKD